MLGAQEGLKREGAPDVGQRRDKEVKDLLGERCREELLGEGCKYKLPAGGERDKQRGQVYTIYVMALRKEKRA